MRFSICGMLYAILLFTSSAFQGVGGYNHTDRRRLPTCSSNSCTNSCTGHDACKNYVWTGNYVITCGASNSERTCRNTVLNCGEGGTCSIKTQGSGHDAYQQSTVNAKTAQSFTLTCAASGQRDCKTITIWCPESAGSTCKCVSCPSTVTMKCINGVSCSSTGGAKVEYVEPTTTGMTISDDVWYKDSSHTGKRPDCYKIQIPGSTTNQNYKWGTLAKCKEVCIQEPTGTCNMLSRYGENSKTSTDNWHCRFYACEDPFNFTWIEQTQWGNYADEANTYIIPVRHYTLPTRYENKTVITYENKTITTYKNETRYNYINISDYYYDDSIIQQLCHEGQYKYYSSTTNEAWTRKSWQLGCNQYKLGITTLSQCKLQCNCNQSPSSYLQHSKYRQCSKISASSNYLPCRQNSCSGGNCCSRSTTICKTACKAYHALKFSGELITYKTVDVPVYKDVIINKTVINYENKTLINYKNKTRYLNITNYIDIIRYRDVIRNKTNYYNITKELIRYINKTRYYDQWINKTKWETKIRWSNKTNTIEIEIPIYKNITIYHNSTKCNCANNNKIYDKPTVSPKIQTEKDIQLSNTTISECPPPNRLMNLIFMIGFFITLAFSVFAALVCIWRCWLKDIIEDFIDDIFCCGYGDNIKACCFWCCLCVDGAKESSQTSRHDEETGRQQTHPSLATFAPVATAVDLTTNVKLDSRMIEMNARTMIEEDVVTPRGTTIKRRRLQI